MVLFMCVTPRTCAFLHSYAFMLWLFCRQTRQSHHGGQVFVLRQLLPDPIVCCHLLELYGIVKLLFSRCLKPFRGFHYSILIYVFLIWCSSCQR